MSDERKKADKSSYRNWHLADSPHEVALVSFEFTLMQLGEAFRRWALQVSRASGDFDMGFNEVVILHVVRMQDRPKDAATIANLLNRDDIPNVQYSLRKLVAAKFLTKKRAGSNFVFTTTALGNHYTEAYTQMRRQLLLGRTAQLSEADVKLTQLSETMSLLTGIYDGAARAAATYWPGEPDQGETKVPEEPAVKRRPPAALKIAQG